MQIKHAVFINLDARTDRRTHIESQIALLRNRDIKVKRLSAVARPQNGALGCALSHCRALSEGVAACTNPKDLILVFEDDFQWEVQQTDIDAALDNLPTDFDVLCLTYYVPKMQPQAPPEKTAKWVRAFDMQTTAGYIVTRQFAEQYLYHTFHAAAETLRAQGATSLPIDVAWKPLQTRHKFYAAWPRLGKQLLLASDISEEKTTTNHNAVVLLMRESAPNEVWPFVHVRKPSGQKLSDALRTVRATYPLLAFIFIIASPTPINVVEMYKFFSKFASPLIGPRSLIGVGQGNQLQMGDCIISARLADKYVQNTKQYHQHYAQAFPSICAKFKQVWDTTWNMGIYAKDEPSTTTKEEAVQPQQIIRDVTAAYGTYLIPAVDAILPTIRIGGGAHAPESRLLSFPLLAAPGLPLEAARQEWVAALQLLEPEAQIVQDVATKSMLPQLSQELQPPTCPSQSL